MNRKVFRLFVSRTLRHMCNLLAVIAYDVYILNLFVAGCGAGNTYHVKNKQGNKLFYVVEGMYNILMVARYRHVFL